MSVRRGRLKGLGRVVATALVIAAMAGCGDLSNGELTRGVASLESMAAEGQLLAGDVARDRTKATFARVRAGELADDADHEAEKLADATPAPGLAGERNEAVALAQALAGEFGTLQVFPGDEARAARVVRSLEARSKRISKLMDRL